MKKNLLILCLTALSFSLFSQEKLDSEAMSKLIIESSKNGDLRISQRVKGKIKLSVIIEIDSVENKHAVIKMEGGKYGASEIIYFQNKIFSRDFGFPWVNKLPNGISPVVFEDLIKSLQFNLKIPVENCVFSKERKVASTVYDVYDLKMDKDTLEAFINKTTQKLELLGTKNDENQVTNNYYFGNNFKIEQPNLRENVKEKPISSFPPFLSYDEKIDGSERVYVLCDVMPEYKGGMNKFNEGLGNSIKFSKEAREMGISGTVYLNFVIEKDGQISNLVVKKGFSKICDAEALRAFKAVKGTWISGQQKGEKVRVALTLPITFKMD